MAVRLTAPHPKYGAEGELLKLDTQDERNLIAAGYAVDAYVAPSKPPAKKAAAKKAPAKPRKAAAAKPADKAVD